MSAKRTPASGTSQVFQLLDEGTWKKLKRRYPRLRRLEVKR